MSAPDLVAQEIAAMRRAIADADVWLEANAAACRDVEAVRANAVETLARLVHAVERRESSRDAVARFRRGRMGLVVA